MHNGQTRKRQHNVKAKDASCPMCHGLRYRIKGAKCECGLARDPKFCPACGGMPERVQGKPGTPCLECGTVAGKNVEYLYVPPRSSAVGWNF